MDVFSRGIEEAMAGATCLVKYELVGGVERGVYAVHVEGGQQLVDVPEIGTSGQLFMVDPCWRNDGTLGAFVADYVAVAERLGCVPVSPEVEYGGLDCDEDDDVLELLFRIGRS